MREPPYLNWYGGSLVTRSAPGLELVGLAFQLRVLREDRIEEPQVYWIALVVHRLNGRAVNEAVLEGSPATAAVSPFTRHYLLPLIPVPTPDATTASATTMKNHTGTRPDWMW